MARTTKDTSKGVRGVQQRNTAKVAAKAKHVKAGLVKVSPAEEPLALLEDELLPGDATPEPAAPWEQLEDEPVRWFDVFTRYRLAGSGRALLVIYNDYLAELGRDRQVRCSGAWHLAFEKWNWRERAQAWDRHRRDVEESEYEARRKKLQDDSLAVAEQMVQKSRTMLSFPLVTERVEETYTMPDGEVIPIVTVVVPAEWTMNTPARLMTAADRVARLTHDMETVRLLREMNRLPDDELNTEAEGRENRAAAP